MQPVKRSVPFTGAKTLYSSFPLSIGTLVMPLDVFVSDLVRNILQFSPKQGFTSLRLRVVVQSVVEGFMVLCYSLDTGLGGKVRALHSLFPQSPVRERCGYRVVGEAVPCSQGSVPGLGGRNTGLWGKWYRALEEILAQFFLQIPCFFRRKSIPCLKSV